MSNTPLLDELIRRGYNEVDDEGQVGDIIYVRNESNTKVALDSPYSSLLGVNLVNQNPTAMFVGDSLPKRVVACLDIGEGGVQSPPISCDGALNWFALGLSLGVNGESPTVPFTGVRYAINGVSYIEDGFGGQLPSGYFGGYDLPNDYPIPTNIMGRGNALQNITNSNLRFEFQLLPENQDQFSLLLFGDNPTIVELGNNHWGLCLSPDEQEPPLPQISCDGATDTSGCIDIEGLWDLEIDGERILNDATPEQIESYLINDTEELTNSPTCCEGNPVFRSLNLPYGMNPGDTVYIPIALTPNGESITSPMIAGGTNSETAYYSIRDQLNAQLTPHGLSAQSMNSGWQVDFGITYYDATNYENTFFYILDEGNTFSEEDIPRGLPPYTCFFPS